jgi:hypothetical protein
VPWALVGGRAVGGDAPDRKATPPLVKIFDLTPVKYLRYFNQSSRRAA